jgi:catechol 2,3-dioxygenase-like lactoylglutathione lyase family enzyme
MRTPLAFSVLVFVCCVPASAAEAPPEEAAKARTPAVVYELRVRDVTASAKFYRDGIGMQVVAENAKDVLLSLFGTGLRLLPARGGNAARLPDRAGNPMLELLAANGFRYPSLWFRDPAAVSQRLEKAGYPKPQQGRNVFFARDPDGNPVEIMRVPRTAQGEAFTVGFLARDGNATRKFLAEILGIAEGDVWNLPAPVGNMYLYPLGATLLKVASPAGDRRNGSAAPLDALGWRSVTIHVKNLPAARKILEERGARPEAEGDRLVVKDPDGNRFVLVAAPAGMAALDLPGAKKEIVPEEARPEIPKEEEVAEPQRPGEPALKKMPDCDATRDAAGRGQMFESIIVPGFTGIREGTNGVAIADLNRDGLADTVATYSAPRGSGGNWGSGEKFRVFINEGCFKFKEHKIRLLNSSVCLEAFGRGQVPVLADFNRDGFLDIFVTRHAQMSGGQSNPREQKLGNGLYVTDGAWDVFRDVSAKMGIQNEKAYNRQASFGDVNRDGWLDIAVGCDNIKNAMGGFPHSRLYVFKPNGPTFENGRFEDIGGTELVPDFGGFYHDSAKDKAGPDINLRDLDNDGDLDLIQSFHVDVLEYQAPYTPVEYRQGVLCWRNLLSEKGELRFEKITGNGLACEAHLKLNAAKNGFEPVGKAPGLPYISLADADNDGLLDVLAVGPASPGWAPRAEYVGGRFWKNLGGFRFEERTEAAGLGALTWTYQKWFEFFECPAPARRLDGRPYFADVVFGDFDNDGWVDVVVQDRSERAGEPARAMLFMNRGDGTFDLKPTTFSGIDGNGICAETADLNNDGLLDLIFAADPDNTGLAADPRRYEDKVYWNTGQHGGKENHWLRLRFAGVSDADLIGARVLLHEAGRAGEPDAKALGMRVISANQSYKSGAPLEAHFGLGKREKVDVRVVLPGGRAVTFAALAADRFLTLDIQTGSALPVGPQPLADP